MKHGPWTHGFSKKDPGFRYQVHDDTSPYLLLGAQDQRLGAEQDQLPCWSAGTSSGNCQETETCISHATTASPKPSAGAPRSVGDAVVGGGHAGWTTSRSGHPCPRQNSSQRPPAENTGKWSLLNRRSCPPDETNLSRDSAELTWKLHSYQFGLAYLFNRPGFVSLWFDPTFHSRHFVLIHVSLGSVWWPNVSHGSVWWPNVSLGSVWWPNVSLGSVWRPNVSLGSIWFDLMFHSRQFMT